MVLYIAHDLLIAKTIIRDRLELGEICADRMQEEHRPLLAEKGP